MDNALAFAVWLQRPGFAQATGHVQAMDWFVISTLCCLFFLLGCFATMGVIIWRRTNRPKPQIRLLMELEDEPDEEVTAPKTNGAQPDRCREGWEKPGDWWQKS
jgi:hypothetical protein